MKIVLLQDIKGVGLKGDVKIVKDGYARNFLLPNSLAVEESSQIGKSLQFNNQQDQEKKLAQKSQLVQEAEKINGQEIIIKAKSNKQGKFYGQIDSSEISKKLKISLQLAHKITIPKIEKAGEYQVDFNLEGHKFNFKIIAQNQN